MILTASKMLDWGDDSFGYQQHHALSDTLRTEACIQFGVAPDGTVEASFTSIVQYGGGVQHQSDGSIVLDRQQVRELAAALNPQHADLVALLRAAPDPDEVPAQELRAWVRTARRLAAEG